LIKSNSLQKHSKFYYKWLFSIFFFLFLESIAFYIYFEYTPTGGFKTTFPFTVFLIINFSSVILSVLTFFYLKSKEENEILLEKFLKSEDSYKSLIENSIDGIFRTSEDGKFLDVNPALVKLLGYDNKEELLAIDIPSTVYFTPEERDKTTGIHESDIIKYRLKTKKGNEVWVEETTRKIVDQTGKIFFEGIVRDITQEIIFEKENEQLMHELEIQKTIFEYIVQFAPFGVLIVDAYTGKVSMHNISHSKIFGITEELVYDYYELWNDQNLTEEMKKMFIHLRDTGDIIYLPEIKWDSQYFVGNELTYKYITRNPIIKTIAYPMIDEKSKVTHFVCIFEDTTNQRNLEAQVRQAQKMESIGTLAGGVAHDFNNLLAGILGNVSLSFLKIDKENNLYKNLVNIETAAKRAAELTKQLLSFSRKVIISPKPINLNNSIDETLQIIKRTFDPRIIIDVNKEANIWPINADTNQIIQVIMNLCINARDAIEKTRNQNPAFSISIAKIIIETSNETIDKEYCDTHFEGFPGDFVCLKITDTGCGMDKRTQEKIFEPFFTTKEIGKGTGLGLSIVYGIIKQHNGWINVYSEPSLGTTFKVFIPRILDVIEMEDYSVNPIIRGGRETILLVDDEDVVRDLGNSVLKNFGYDVIIAKDGLEAFELYKEKKEVISLVIADYSMPKMDGIETINQIHKINPEQKVILISGYIVNGETISSIKNSINAFVQKPYQPAYLAQKVREILDGQ
jgi:two-component system, cell cycle sensor histidine kinase and response regulator CckA